MDDGAGEGESESESLTWEADLILELFEVLFDFLGFLTGCFGLDLGARPSSSSEEAGGCALDFLSLRSGVRCFVGEAMGDRG